MKRENKMIKRSIKPVMFLLFVLMFSGCEASVDNSITFNNQSLSDIIVSFRGQAISVATNQTTVIKEIPKGTNSYSTVFTKPAGATSTETKGDVSGNISIKAGTKILILYTYTLEAGVYTLNATLSSSDDQTTITAP